MAFLKIGINNELGIKILINKQKDHPYLGLNITQDVLCLVLN